MLSGLSVLLTEAQRRDLLLLLFGLMVAALLEMAGIIAIPLFVGLLTDPNRVMAAVGGVLNIRMPASSDLSRITLAGACILVVFFLLKNTAIAGLVYLEARVLKEIASGVSFRLFRAYLTSPYAFHLRHNPADLIRNIESETGNAVQLIRSSLLVVRELLVLTVVFVLLILMEPIVSVSVFCMLSAAAGSFYLLVRKQLSLRGELAQGHRGRQTQAVNQGLGAIKDAKVMGREAHLMEVFRRENVGKEREELYWRVVAALPKLFLEVLAVAAVLIVAAVFTFMDRPVQAMLPVLALLTVAVVRLVPAFNGITSAFSSMRYHRASFNLVRMELETLEPRLAHNSTEMNAGGSSHFGAVELDDVCFTYEGAKTPAIQGVTLQIRPFEAVALVGPSGAGKSTLVDLFLGLLVPGSGRIAVDGQNIQNDLRGWQAQLGYVAQDIYLLDDTIRRNIAFGLGDQMIDEVAVMAAVRTAQLTDFISALPDGLDTVVGNRGVRLSGGQRQRIGIARALYHNPPVLVLDEATSALDNETERAVIAAIADLRGQRTLLIVAHRLTTVVGCDRLYLMAAGRIQDQGTYEELARRHEQLRLVPAGRASA